MHLSIEHRKIQYQWINRNQRTEKGPVIIFLHDGLGSIGQWKDFPEILCKQLGLQGLAYDREGYGLSSFWSANIPEDYLQIEALEVLPALLNRLNIKKYFLFGHSDGGTLNLYHAASKPEGLIAMVVEAPHVIIENKTKEALVKIEQLNDPMLISKLDKYHNGRASKLVCLWTSYWMRPKFLDWNMIDVLKQIESDILLIQGDEDEFGSYEQLDTVSQYSKGVSHQLRLKECGHIPHHQQKDLVLEKTVQFFNQFL